MLKKLKHFSLLLFISVQTVDAASLGSVSENALMPVSILGHVFMITCYILGTGLFLGGFVQYQAHRQNPSQVRLSTPITLWILGATLIAIPLLTGYSIGAHDIS